MGEGWEIMENETLIRKIHMSCPLCVRVHEVEERKRIVSINFKGEDIPYEERFYFCVNAADDENEFETGRAADRSR